MDRNREARRASIVGSNGFNRRRHRTNSLRDSPDEDGGLELQESVRLRDRVKKDRDRERDRERERERERERDLRERSSRSKRRRGERLTSNREDIGGDETSDEDSLNDDEDDDDEENTTVSGSGGGVRLLTQAASSVPNHHHHHHHGHNSNHHQSHSSSFSQQHNSNSTSNTVSSNHLQHRKSFPPNPSSAKISRAPPVWKSGDEMISVPVPRKARSASTKRSHDWMSISSNNSGGGVSGVEQNLGQPSNSPARQGVAPTATPTPPPPPVSPTSSNASIRKKLKPNPNNSGQKLKPPKAATKPTSNSSNPEELEIEIAEVLYGLMTQTQAPSTKKENSRESNRLSSDAKSRNSSPISNSTLANNLISGSNSAPFSAVAPKRKKPRHIPENSSYVARSIAIQAKLDADQEPKSEKISGSLAENGNETAVIPVQPLAPAQVAPPESEKIGSEVKPATEEITENRDSVAKIEASSPKEKESPAVRASSAAAMSKVNSTATEMENRKEEKFEIDLMAPPPQVRPSPEREAKIGSKDLPVAIKPAVPISDVTLKAALKDESHENGKSERENSRVEEKVKAGGEEVESKKGIENKEGKADLHVDLEKCERDGGDGVNAAGNGNKSQSLTQKQQQSALPENSGHSTGSLPLPMSMASWPGGLPPMGYMAPLQGVVSMEGGAVAPGHIPPLFTQPRPKRCATHCHIARNIHYLQQFMKMNPFWPPPAASTSLFGSKPGNLNVIPGPDMHGNVAVRGANTAQDKAQNVVAKEKGSQPASVSDSAQRKQQILIQQPLPPVAPSNLLGTTFIFPLNQQQSAAQRPSVANAKSPAAAAGVPSAASCSAVTSSSSAAALSFNYPNMASNETQYLAIVQNNGYSFPIPAAAVGAPPNYRGNPAQAMPLFNAPFYSSQMIHPSQLQHVQPPSVQSQLLHAHQNASATGGVSESQKQQQQQRIQSSGSVSSGSGIAGLQNLSSQKTQPSQQLQQSNNHYVHQSRPRHHEGEPGREDSPSTTDSRGYRPSMNMYGQNFPMPIHNFGLMTHPATLASAAAATSSSSNHGDKKGHQAQQQQQGSKTVPDSLPAHSFAMTFGTMNGAGGPGIDITSMAQNHAIFQNSSEVTRQNIQMMAAAQAAQKNFRDDGKPDSSAGEDEAKSLSGKALGGGGQSIAFSRSDLGDGPVSSVQPNSVSSAASGAARGSRSMATNAVGGMNVQNALNIQTQLQQQHLLQLKQLQQQQQQMQQQMAANRSKVAVNSNGGMYSEHSSLKFPNALSGFPQNLGQSNNSSSSSPTQSPSQWKASARISTHQTSSSLASSTTTTLKNLPQQHSRTQPPMHTQISFGGNQKPSPASQGPNNQTSSPQMMVGSPTTSSVSKGASGSPRTSSASTNNKTGQASSLSAQPTKNSPAVTNQKSPSILGNPAAIGTVQNSQMQQVPKATMQQQLFFSNPYAQSQPPHSSGKSSTTSGYYMARRPTDQHQQSPGAAVTSGGGLSLCPPVTLGCANTNDPATAITAATANAKGGIIHASQFGGQTVLPAGFSYVPAAVPVKPAEQKQPAGNDNLHPWQPEKK